MIIVAGLPSMEVADAPPSDGETAKTPAPAPGALSETPAAGGRRPAGRRSARRDTDGSASGANPHGGYHCSYCGKYFSSRSNMVVHERTHTHERPYTCTHCGRTFSQHGQMVIHVRSHTGQRPFKCTHCDKAFTSSKVLKIHVRTHTGEKPYACEHCDKRFAAYANLVVHRRIHTKVRPYNCRHCKRTFEHSGNLQRHVRAHGIVNGEEDGDDPCGGETEQCRTTAAAEAAAAAAAAAAAGLRCRLCQAAYSGPASLLEHRCPRLVRRPRRGVPQDPADTQPLSFIELFEYIEQLRQQAQDPTAVPGAAPYQVKSPSSQWQPHQQQQQVTEQPPEVRDPDQQLQLPGQYEPQVQPTSDQEGHGLQLPVAAVEHAQLQPLQPSPEEAVSLPHEQQQPEEEEEEQYRLHVLQPRPRLALPQPVAVQQEQERPRKDQHQQPEQQQQQRGQGLPQGDLHSQRPAEESRSLQPSEEQRQLHPQYYQQHPVQHQQYIQHVQPQQQQPVAEGALQPPRETQYQHPALPLPPRPSFQPPPDRQEGFLPPGGRNQPTVAESPAASLVLHPSPGELRPPMSITVTPGRSDVSVGTSPSPPRALQSPQRAQSSPHQAPPSPRQAPPSPHQTPPSPHQVPPPPPPPPPPPLQRSFSTQTEPTSPPSESRTSSDGRLSVELRPSSGASSPSQRHPPSQGRPVSADGRPVSRERPPAASEGSPSSGERSTPERRHSGGRNQIWEELLAGEHPPSHERPVPQERPAPLDRLLSHERSSASLGRHSGEDPASSDRSRSIASAPAQSTPNPAVISSAFLAARDRLRSAVHRHPSPEITSDSIAMQHRAALLPSNVYPTTHPGLTAQQRYAVRVGLTAPSHYAEPVMNGGLMTYGYGIPQRLMNGFSAAPYGGPPSSTAPMPSDELVITVKPSRPGPAPVAGSSAAEQVTSPGGARSGGLAKVTVLEQADVTVSGPLQRLPRKSAGRSPRVRSRALATLAPAAPPAPAPAPSLAPAPAPALTSAPAPVSAPVPQHAVVSPPASQAAQQLSLLSPPAKRRRACPGLVPLSAAPPTSSPGDGRRASVTASPAAVQVTVGQWSAGWGAVPGRRAPHTR